jgi:hypothetical protein
MCKTTRVQAVRPIELGHDEVETFGVHDAHRPQLPWAKERQRAQQQRTQFFGSKKVC